MEEHKVLTFFKRNGWVSFLTFTALILLALVIDRSWDGKKRTSEEDYSAALKVVSRQKEGEPLSQQAIDHLENILTRHPELHPHYDTLLALSFLQQDNPTKVLKCSKGALAAAGNSLSPPFASYSEGSLLIIAGEYEKALAHARALEEKLEEKSAHSTLRAFNLLRLSFLGKKLGNTALQKESFEKLQSLPLYPRIGELYQEGTYTLKDFLS